MGAIFSSEPPAAAQSPFLATFDEVFARLTVEDEQQQQTQAQTSNTMRVALNNHLAALNSAALSTHGVGPTFPAPPPVSAATTAGEPGLPLYSYKAATPVPTLHYIRDEAEADAEVAKLNGPLGFDLEWRAFFTRGTPQGKAAILQLSDAHTILIIQLTAMKTFPPKLKALVEAPDVVKMGVNILNDGRKLHRDYNIAPAGLLELSHLAHAVDPARVPSRRMMALQRIVELYTGRTLAKGAVRTSNWEARLSAEQLEYAANDAHAAVGVYAELVRIAREKGLAIDTLVAPFLTSTSTGTAGRPYAPPRYTGPQAPPGSRPMRPQHRRAYVLWHEQGLSLTELRGALRSPEEPLAKSTVITYVVDALKTDTTLPFSRARLRALAELDRGSWEHHRSWINALEGRGRGEA